MQASTSLLRRHLGSLLAMGVLLVLLAVFSWPTVRLAVLPMDEGNLLEYPILVQHGAEPNRDFETFYGPGNLWVLAGAYSLAGPSVATERAIGWAYRAVIVIAIFLLSRRRSLLVGLAGGILACILVTLIGPPAYAWLGGMACALIGLYLGTDERYPFIAGCLGGAAVLFRPELIVPAAIVGIFIANKKRYMWGALAGLAPMVIHVARVGITASIRTMLLDPLRVSDYRRLPLDARSTGNLDWVVIGSVVLCLLVGIVVARKKRDRVLLTIALFQVGLLPQALQRADTTHLLMVGCITIPMVPLFAASVPKMPASAGIVLLTGAAVIAAGLFVRAGALAPRSPEGFAVSHDGRMLYVRSADEASQLTALAADLDQRAQPGDSIIVGPTDMTRTPYNDTFLYFFFPDLTPGTFYLEMNPGSANGPTSRLAEDLATARFAIVTDRYDWWAEPNASMDPGSPDAQRVLEDRFCFVASYGPWDLLEACHPSSG